MISFTSKDNSFIFSINDNTISKHHFRNHHFFTATNATLNLNDIIKIKTFPDPIYIGTSVGGLIINKEDFTSDEWVTINAELHRFKLRHSTRINENLINSVIRKIETDYGLSPFKVFVENAPYKESSLLKGKESLFKLRIFTQIPFRGEESWVAATPFAKEVYDLIIQKGL